MKYPYINIHSHGRCIQGEWAIHNYHHDFHHIPKGTAASVGLHPWHINVSTFENDFASLQACSKEPTVVAIGECGLDRLSTIDIPFQEKVFVTQLLWANEINKPLIIHCVRAHDAVLHLLRQHKNQVPVIFHGFNNALKIAQKIWEEGHAISFGESLKTARMQTVMDAAPLHAFFLETDTSTINIHDQYQLAANIRNISVEDLSLQLHETLGRFFNITLK